MKHLGPVMSVGLIVLMAALGVQLYAGSDLRLMRLSAVFVGVAALLAVVREIGLRRRNSAD